MFFEYSDQELKDLMEKDKVLHDLIEKNGRIECRINDNLFECIVYAIISQQIPKKRADLIMDKLRQLSGYIEADKILKLSSSQMQSCGITFRKTAFIRRLAEGVEAESIDLNEIKMMDDEEALKALCQLPAIGQWTAEMLMIFSMNRKNIFSRKDKLLKKGLMKAYQCEITEEFLDECQRKFSPYCTLASLYLWKEAKSIQEEL